MLLGTYSKVIVLISTTPEMQRDLVTGWFV